MNSRGIQFNVSRSDEGGTFSFDLPPGTMTLIARADGYVSEQREMVVPAGVASPPVHFKLSPAGSVSGTVIDGSGTPVPGARVWLSYRGEVGGWRRGEELGGDETDRLGHFTIPVVAQNRPFLLHAESEGWLLSSSGSLQLLGHELTGVILLLSRRGIVVSGRVLNATGQPVPGASVRLRATPEDGEFSKEQRAAFAYARSTHKVTATATDGSYTLTGVPVGRLVITGRIIGCACIRRDHRRCWAG